MSVSWRYILELFKLSSLAFFFFSLVKLIATQNRTNFIIFYFIMILFFKYNSALNLVARRQLKLLEARETSSEYASEYESNSFGFGLRRKQRLVFFSFHNFSLWSNKEAYYTI
jgi:hypothetical protein